MSIFLQMEKAKDKVLYLLRNHPELRDSDSRLIATYWHNELGKKSIEMSGFDVLQKIAKGELTKAESIRRVRQKIQEENIELRGKVWLEKQLKKEEVRQKIRNL